MKRLSRIFRENKKLILVSAALLILIMIACILFGGGNVSIYSSASESVSQSETEIKLVNILSEIDGVGKAEVMINEGEDGIDGVVIVCEGADSLLTRSNIIDAVCVALKVERSDIAIYSMKQ